MRSGWLHGVLMAAALLLAGSSASAQTNVLFILDASGSMKQVVGSEAKIVAAKRVMKATLADMPAEARLGLMLYGHRRAKDCTDIELVSPIGADDAATTMIRTNIRSNFTAFLLAVPTDSISHRLSRDPSCRYVVSTFESYLRLLPSRVTLSSLLLEGEFSNTFPHYPDG